MELGFDGYSFQKVIFFAPHVFQFETIGIPVPAQCTRQTWNATW